MSKNLRSKEEAINQLYTTIKTKFQQDGVLQEMRCLLQAKMVEMMKGKSEMNSLVQRPSTSPAEADAGYGDGANGNACISLLHQLIMEYFQWHGFHYSAQMFAQESACENIRTIRDCFEVILGNFGDKSIPVLLQLVANQMEKHRASQPHHCDQSNQ